MQRPEQIRIADAARESVRGKTTYELRKMAQRALIEMTLSLKDQGGDITLLDKVGRFPRVRLENGEQILEVPARDVQVAMGVVRMLGGNN